MRKNKLIFFVNHAAFFVSHRLNLALKAAKDGYEVEILLGKAASNIEEKIALKTLKENNLKYKKLPFKSSEVNLFRNFYALFVAFFYIKKNKPDLIHLISPKAILLGGILARYFRVKGIVLSISGMGYLFTDNENLLNKIYKLIYMFCLSYILKHKNKKVIVQNKDDYRFFFNKFKLNKNEIVRIRGSGVNLDKFNKINVRNKYKQVLFVGRVIKEKGVKEFIESVEMLNKLKKYKFWNYLIVGELNYDKSSKFQKKDIENWKKIKKLKFLGYKRDIHKYYKLSSIICLPSYREGMPKVLLEAAASGRPVITTNTIGCKEAIINYKTGELCRVKDSYSLFNSLSKFMDNKNLREYYGRNGRILARKEFDIKKVSNHLVKIYKNLSS